MKKTTALLLAASIALPALGQQTKILTAEKHNEYGLVYSLPLTSLEVEVTATCRTDVAGPFFQYAKKYIGTDKVVKENSEEWNITDVRLTPYGTADRKTSYLMQLKPGVLTYIGVSDDGMLLTINAAPEAAARHRQSAPRPMDTPARSTGKEYLQYVDEDFLGSQSKAKQAEMLAASLMEVRDSKISLTRGTADNMPTDGRQLELMLADLEKQEKALTEAFTGRSYTQTATRTFTYRPDKDGRITLFRLSDFAGFVEADDYSGEPVYLNVELLHAGELPKDADGVEKKFPKDGVAYRLPGTVRVTLSFRSKTLLSKEMEMAQFGTVFGLDPKLFTSKKEPSYAIFDPATGALREIGIVEPEEEQKGE